MDLKMIIRKITIIGLGLIGGSLAKALHEKAGFENIIAIDKDEDALKTAMEEGTISLGLKTPDSSVYSSDMIIISTPVNHTIKYIKDLVPHIPDTCIITDTCSIKGEIVRCVEQLNPKPCFVGGHPMAGTEMAGYKNSFPHMFENAYYVLTPCSSTTPEALDKLACMVEAIGAIPVVIKAGEHDRITGSISHIPHIIAAALVNLVKESDDGSGKMRTLAAGGFRDITRIASSSPAMWENIVISNKRQIINILKSFNKSLLDFMCSLEKNNTPAITQFFTEAKQFRDSIPAHSAGLLKPICRLIVDVRDKPGIIGEIATVLGNNNINIKNINVTNSREFEQGCLIIDLPDISSVNNAFDLLMNKGYKVYKS